MTFQHVSTHPRRVIDMAKHHAAHAVTAEQREAAKALAEAQDFEAWHGSKAPADLRTFESTVFRAPIRPTIPRRRRPAPLSLFLAGCALGVALAFAVTAALADHLIYRSQIELARAIELEGM